MQRLFEQNKNQQSTINSKFTIVEKISSELAKPLLKDVDDAYKRLKVLPNNRLVKEYHRLCYLINCQKNNTEFDSSDNRDVRGFMLAFFPLWPITLPIAGLWYLRDNNYHSEIDKTKSQIQLLIGIFIGEAESYNEFLRQYACHLESKALEKDLSSLKIIENNDDYDNNLKKLSTVVIKLNSLFKNNTQKAKSEILTNCYSQASGRLLSFAQQPSAPSVPLPYNPEHEPPDNQVYPSMR